MAGSHPTFPLPAPAATRARATGHSVTPRPAPPHSGALWPSPARSSQRHHAPPLRPGIIKGRHRGRRRLELPPWRRGGGCSSSMPRPSPPAPPSASPVAEAAELELTAAGPASCIRNLLGADVGLAGLGAELGQPLRAHPCARLIILTSPCSIMLAPTLAITLARSPLRSFLRSHLCDGSTTKGSGEHYFFVHVRLLL